MHVVRSKSAIYVMDKNGSSFFKTFYQIRKCQRDLELNTGHTSEGHMQRDLLVFTVLHPPVDFSFCRGCSG